VATWTGNSFEYWDLFAMQITNHTLHTHIYTVFM
jgi:hypothetical protein